MNIFYLKKYRKRFEYREDGVFRYVLIDHQNKSATKCKDFDDMMETIIYRLAGLDSQLDWSSKRLYRRKRAAYYKETKRIHDS